MLPSSHCPIKVLTLLTLSVFMQSSPAQELPQLPEALDAGWQGEEVCQLMYETETVRVARCSFPPGTGHEKHFHYPHFGYVLESATMLITDADGLSEERQTVAGTTWSTNEITIHEAVNVGDTTATYLIIEPRQ